MAIKNITVEHERKDLIAYLVVGSFFVSYSNCAILAIIRGISTRVIMTRNNRVDLVEIDAARINDVCRLYFLWKDLNTGLRGFVSRGINFPEAISEPMGCYALGYRWNKGSAGDAVDPNGRNIEMKATSNFDRDLTSFGPVTVFDDLVFLRLNQVENRLYIYETGINGNTLGDFPANANETVGEQQQQGRRPRISIIKTIIEGMDLEPTAIFDIRTMEVITQ